VNVTFSTKVEESKQDLNKMAGPLQNEDLRRRLALIEAEVRDTSSRIHVDGLLVSFKKKF
jgi:hypothetical protein